MISSQVTGCYRDDCGVHMAWVCRRHGTAYALLRFQSLFTAFYSCRSTKIAEWNLGAHNCAFMSSPRTRNNN